MANPFERLMATPLMRKAPWVLYLLLCLLATGITITCVRLQLGDDVTAAICAALTCGLIMATGLCIFVAMKSRTEDPKPKKKRVTVCLKAEYLQGHDTQVDLLCPICLVELEVGTRVVNLECQHVFHVDCISAWVNRKAQCPACRFDLPTMLTSPTPSPPMSAI